MTAVKVVPEWIGERVRRQPPADAPIVRGSTPVISFGDPAVARVATLGLNPSASEFLDRGGRLLGAGRRRLATLESIGAASLSEADDAAVAQVVADCNDYFRKPTYYGRHFNSLEAVIKPALAVSYFDGSACHLDLVQWATSPMWAQLPPAIKERLAAEDREFLLRQLATDNIRLVIVNGRTVLNELWRLGVDELRWTDRFAAGTTSVQLAYGSHAGTTFIGWTAFRPTQAGSTTTAMTDLLSRMTSEIVYNLEVEF